MMTATQLRAARVLLAMDQRTFAKRAGLSLPTIQRMESSAGVIRGNVGSLAKIIAALRACGVELIEEGEPSPDGGLGVRLRDTQQARQKAQAAQADRAPLPGKAS